MVINVNEESNRSIDDFKDSIKGKHIPILTLDNKWHELFAISKKTPEVIKLEEQVNELLKRQGFLNQEIKDLKKLKSNLMNEIVENMELTKNAENVMLDKHQELIREINDKIDAYNDELLDLPALLKGANEELMILTMDICYHRLYDNSKLIIEISEWIRKVRNELKNRIMKKKAKEIENQLAYTYMHNIFGAEVINVFDLKYIDEGPKNDTLPNDVTSRNITNKAD